MADGAGGGGSDVRIRGTALANRVLGGGGGGGGGATTDPDPCCNGPGAAGGIGAFPVGDTRGGTQSPGTGGSQSAGGTIGPAVGTDGAAGMGSAGGSFGGGGGGGGSSTGPSGTTHQDGVRGGHGAVVIAYTA